MTKPDFTTTHLALTEISETLGSENGQIILGLHLDQDADAPRLSDDPYTRRLECAAICRSVGRLLGVPVR